MRKKPGLPGYSRVFWGAGLNVGVAGWGGRGRSHAHEPSKLLNYINFQATDCLVAQVGGAAVESHIHIIEAVLDLPHLSKRIAAYLAGRADLGKEEGQGRGQQG